jgi:hypothetical protein
MSEQQSSADSAQTVPTVIHQERIARLESIVDEASVAIHGLLENPGGKDEWDCLSAVLPRLQREIEDEAPETCDRCMGTGYSNHPDSGEVCDVCKGSGAVFVRRSQTGVDGQNFECAIHKLKSGIDSRWRRQAWKPGKWIELNPTCATSMSYLEIRYDDGRAAPWCPTRCDIFEADWVQMPPLSSPARTEPQSAWSQGEREAVARALFGDGWQCCANLGPYVKGIVNELNEARELIDTLDQDLVEHQRDLIAQCKEGSDRSQAEIAEDDGPLKFADYVENIAASFDNPIKYGRFVRIVNRTGRLNAGKFVEYIDDHGETHLTPPDNIRRRDRTALSRPPHNRVEKTNGSQS